MILLSSLTSLSANINGNHFVSTCDLNLLLTKIYDEMITI
jgi:hypothetical protein